uniref:Putative secreted protein n=1 Tax=Anopheles darlingi TaxID=43151 RepID=A0A2M4D041_ANODA
MYARASSLWLVAFSSFRSASIFSSLARTCCSSAVAATSCSSVRWTASSGITRTSSRHQGQSRTFRKARTFRCMHRTASSCSRRRARRRRAR